jgi:hypothetical protein
MSYVRLLKQRGLWERYLGASKGLPRGLYAHKDKEKEKEKEKEEYADGVFLTEEQYNKLLNEWEKADVDLTITCMAEWQTRNRMYKDHYLAILKWLKRDVKAGKIKQKPQQKRCPECGEVMHGAGCSCGYAEAV